jgi:hypothetical protein
MGYLLRGSVHSLTSIGYFCGADAGPDWAPGLAGFLEATSDCEAAASVGGLAALLPNAEEVGAEAAFDGSVVCATAHRALDKPALTAAAAINEKRRMGGMFDLLKCSGLFPHLDIDHLQRVAKAVETSRGCLTTRACEVVGRLPAG